MSDIYPGMLYRDPLGAVDFLHRAFGFERHLVVPDTGRGVAHAELRVGTGFIMLGGLRPDHPVHRAPQQLGGKSTGMVYIGTHDVDALYARACAAGAETLEPPHDTDYGSHDFSARDPEGFAWSFGTYQPTVHGQAAAGSPPEVYTGMRYRNAREAIDWLGRAFGFEVHVTYPPEGEPVVHAQLRLGESLLMTGSLTADNASRMTTPDATGGAYTLGYCAYVPDPDAHQARAAAAGAEIVSPASDTDYGARMYTVRDLGGYTWTFGTYRPAREPVTM